MARDPRDNIMSFFVTCLCGIGIILTLGAIRQHDLSLQPDWEIGSCIHPLVNEGDPFDIKPETARFEGSDLYLTTENGPASKITGAACAVRMK